MNRTLTTFSAIIALLLPVGHADILAGNYAEKEIQHLLEFIGTSSCTFIRNGDAYPASEARSHIQHKFAYVKSRVRSAEDFIKYTATQSSFSGKPYQVDCAGKKLLSKDWLNRELEQYRQNDVQTDSRQAALN